jgi:hypothetical protein
VANQAKIGENQVRWAMQQNRGAIRERSWVEHLSHSLSTRRSSPPATLEIIQLELLAEERLGL